MVDASGSYGYAYDNRDRLNLKTVSWTNGPSISLNYRYDANGNLTNLWSNTPGGVTNAYQYDALNRLTNVLAAGSAAASYGFDGLGNLQSLHYGNGVTNQYQYDSLNRLTNLVWKTNGLTIASFAYQLGLTGNRTNLVESVGTVSRTNRWQYDALYRLTNEVIIAPTNGALAYTYDLVGNRLSRTTNGNPGLSLTNQTFAFDTNDWQTNTDNYDSDGNTTSSAGRTYGYDALDRIVAVTNGGTVITLKYDGDGNRVGKTISGVTTFYLVDDRNPSGYAQVVEEWTVTGSTNLSRVYAYGLDLISQKIISGSTTYYGYDGHGSVRFLTGTNGVTTNTYTYDAYGALTGQTGSTANNYLYSGQQYDSDLGFYYLRARFMNPNTGRFWTRDIYGGDNEDPLSLHKYLYCGASPIDHIDPSGNDGDLLTLLTVISIGVNLDSAFNHALNHQYGMMTLDLLGAASGGFGLAGELGLLENSLPTSLQFASGGVAGLSQAQALQGISVVIAGTDLIIAMSNKHHIMTDKNSVSDAPNGAGPFTPKFKDLLDGTGISLGDDINLVEVEGHSGPHPEANEYVWDAFQNAIKGLKKGSEGYKQAVIATFQKLGKEAATPGTPLNLMLTHK